MSKLMEKTRLPGDFDIAQYLKSFRELAPIPGITPTMNDETLTFVANTAFYNECLALEKTGLVKHTGSTWVILKRAKSRLAKLNVLPIAIHAGANVFFVEDFEKWA